MQTSQPPGLPEDLATMVYWVLSDDMRTPVAIPILEGIAWSNAHGSIQVAIDEAHGASVSTVFIPQLGLPQAAPALFQTQVTRPRGWTERHAWSTWEEALDGHRGLVRGLASGDAPTVH